MFNVFLDYMAYYNAYFFLCATPKTPFGNCYFDESLIGFFLLVSHTKKDITYHTCRLILLFPTNRRNFCNVLNNSCHGFFLWKRYNKKSKEHHLQNTMYSRNLSVLVFVR